MTDPAAEVIEIATVDKEGNASLLRLRPIRGFPSAIEVLEGMSVIRRYEANHFLDALCKLRKEYEPLGISLLCKGARSDIVLSGMSISMSSGRKAYVTKIGVQASREDLVDIFEPELAENTAPVAAQIAHQEAWRAHWREVYKLKDVSPMTGNDRQKGTETKKWPESWRAVTENHQRLLIEEELRKEVSEGHALWKQPVEVIARRIDNDDVLVQLQGVGSPYAQVHLTWSRKPERDLRWPKVTMFSSLQEWCDRFDASSENRQEQEGSQTDV